MSEYDFILKFKLQSPEEDAANYLPALEEAGCDDALIGTGQVGHVILDFTRESESAGEAMVSAISNVYTAIKDVVLIEASPDYVGVTDVADILNISRQAVYKIINENKSKFPSPLHTNKTSIWYLSEITNFFHLHTQRKFKKSISEVAQVARAVNTYSQLITLQCRDQSPECISVNYTEGVEQLLNKSHLFKGDTRFNQ